MSEAYICLDCEQALRHSSVELDAHGACKQCGSRAVMSEEILLAALAKRKTTSSPATAGVATLAPSKQAFTPQARKREVKTIESDLKLPLRHSVDGCSGRLRMMIDFYGQDLDCLTFECEDCKTIVGKLADAVVADDLRVVDELTK